MSDLNSSITELRKKYREIFKTSAEEIYNQVQKIKPNNFDGEIFDKYPINSNGYIWQKETIKLLQNDISKEIFRKLNEILAYRSEFKCSGCATCCKLACSEYSPEELKNKAKNGDNFATQFTSIFVPYSSKEEARKVYPEYIQLLEDNNEHNVYFYYCPKLNKDNRCSDYENRPQICRNFPDNPLSILPETCGYNSWKTEIEPIALMLHSMLEIIDFYIKKLEKIHSVNN